MARNLSVPSQSNLPRLYPLHSSVFSYIATSTSIGMKTIPIDTAQLETFLLFFTNYSFSLSRELDSHQRVEPGGLQRFLAIVWSPALANHVVASLSKDCTLTLRDCLHPYFLAITIYLAPYQIPISSFND